jgi:hypothetical protein
MVDPPRAKSPAIVQKVWTSLEIVSPTNCGEGGPIFLQALEKISIVELAQSLEIMLYCVNVKCCLVYLQPWT